MTGIADLEATIARLEAAAADAREVTRELHSATKAARAAERDLTALSTRIVKVDIPTTVSEQMQKMIDDGIRANIDALKVAIRDGLKCVDERFTEVANRCIYGNAQGRGPNVLDQVRDRILRADELLAQRNRMMAGESLRVAPANRQARPDLPSLKD